jgi:SAM-dependent methyltransferase
MADAHPAAAYDRVAHLYDVDMARNMPFDDVGFYTGLAARVAGRVLEVGCGNGRILLELLKRGVDAYGIDRSAAMLAELRRKAGSAPLSGRVIRMDARSLAFKEAFALVLCPYSLITYMTAERDAERMLGGIRRALTARGRVVIDAFVPQPELPSAGFRVDYQRPHGQAVLTREKRVTSLTPGLNRIERRYGLAAADGTRLESIETSEDIRLFAPETLRNLLVASGFSIEVVWWDYASSGPHFNPRFFTACARLAE